MRGILTFSRSLSLIWSAFAEEPQAGATVCGQHPASARETISGARAAGHGIRSQHLAELEQARRDGKPLGRLVEVRGDCPAEETPS